jgi:hypothetical protein
LSARRQWAPKLWAPGAPGARAQQTRADLQIYQPRKRSISHFWQYFVEELGNRRVGPEPPISGSRIGREEGSMSAFQAYAGGYEFEGQSFGWRCYATTRVHAVRRREHAPLPPAPEGRTWRWQSSDRRQPEVAWLVDEGAEEFSHILLQIDPSPRLAEAI